LGWAYETMNVDKAEKIFFLSISLNTNKKEVCVLNQLGLVLLWPQKYDDAINGMVKLGERAGTMWIF